MSNNKHYMVEIARDAIREVFEKRSIIDKEKLLKEHPELAQKGAAFVTLEKRESLRGCIGSLIAHRTLLEDIIKNARSAAFHDPRFPPLTKEEFEDPYLTVEISLLSEPKPLSYSDVADLKSKIQPGRDGVILKLGHYQATYLPQVWEQLPRFEDFFATLCQKAGLPGNCLESHPEIYIYHAEKIK